MRSKKLLVYSGRFILILIAIPLVLITTISILIANDVFEHNKILKGFSEQLYSYPLPPQTKEVGRRDFVENTGNGNHCDYFAALSIESSLSKNEIEDYYKNLEYLNIPEYGIKRLKHKANIEFLDNSPDKKTRAEISIVDAGHSAGFDMRCR